MSEPHTADLGTRYRYRLEGAQLERERIIKLLQETRESRPCQCDECGDHVWGKAIELIKGEQK